MAGTLGLSRGTAGLDARSRSAVLTCIRALGGTLACLLSAALFTAPVSGAGFERVAINPDGPVQTVYHIERDATGFLWFATSEGMHRFDGYDFRHWWPEDLHDPFLGDLESVSIDVQERIWLGTGGGRLLRYDGRSGRLRDVQLAPGSDELRAITDILATGDGGAWVGTTSGLLRFDDSLEPVDLQAQAAAALSKLFVTSIEDDRTGGLWIGTQSGLLHLGADGEVQHYAKEPLNDNSLSDNRINDILLDHRGRLWVGTYSGGLNRFDVSTAQWRRYYPDAQDPQSFASTAAKLLFEDSRQQLWIGTWGDGLERYDPGTDGFHHFRNDPDDEHSIPDNRVYALQEDARGFLWVGTFVGGGRMPIEPPRFALIQRKKGSDNTIPSNQVQSLLIDSRSRLWLGTYSNGAAVVDLESGTVRSFRHDAGNPNSLANNGIWSLLETRDGSIWLGSSQGVHRYREADQQFERFQPSAADPRPFSGSNILTMTEAEDGAIWLGTWENGINRWYPGTAVIDVFLPEPGAAGRLQGRATYALERTRDGALWVGTDGAGVHRLARDGHHFEQHLGTQTAPEGLREHMVLSLHEDPSGKPLVGYTARTLYLESGSQILRDGAGFPLFPRLRVAAIEGDAQGNLWFSSDRGLFKRRIDGSVRRFDRRDGLPALRFLTGSSARHPDGRLFFGSTRGIVSF